MRRAGLIVFALFVGAAPAAAQPPPAPQDPPPASAPGTAASAEEGGEEEDEEGEVGKTKRPQHSRGLTKIRSGSFLRRNQPEERSVDMRGEFERRRDFELVRHFSRMAELDVVAKVAEEIGDGQLAGEVDAVRRAELERFRLAMQHLQLIFQARLQTGLP